MITRFRRHLYSIHGIAHFVFVAICTPNVVRHPLYIWTRSYIANTRFDACLSWRMVHKPLFQKKYHRKSFPEHLTIIVFYSPLVVAHQNHSRPLIRERNKAMIKLKEMLVKLIRTNNFTGFEQRKGPKVVLYLYYYV